MSMASHATARDAQTYRVTWKGCKTEVHARTYLRTSWACSTSARCTVALCHNALISLLLYSNRANSPCLSLPYSLPGWRGGGCFVRTLLIAARVLILRSSEIRLTLTLHINTDGAFAALLLASTSVQLASSPLQSLMTVPNRRSLFLPCLQDA